MNWLNEMIEWYYATRLDEDEIVEDPTYTEQIVIAEWEIE